jgi:hypothetical protein
MSYCDSQECRSTIGQERDFRFSRLRDLEAPHQYQNDLVLLDDAPLDLQAAS